MTALQFVENILRQKWHSSISGRPHDVGQIGDRIKIVYESDDEWRKMDLANYDYLTIRDGGKVSTDPMGLGWNEESVDSVVDIDIRTKGWSGEGRPGRIALYGERGAGDLAPNESPRWGGLVGEATRTMKSIRKGEREFDIVRSATVDDLSSQMGGQVWRANVNVGLEVRSNKIDTEP